MKIERFARYRADVPSQARSWLWISLEQVRKHYRIKREDFIPLVIGFLDEPLEDPNEPGPQWSYPRCSCPFAKHTVYIVEQKRECSKHEIDWRGTCKWCFGHKDHLWEVNCNGQLFSGGIDSLQVCKLRYFVAGRALEKLFLPAGLEKDLVEFIEAAKTTSV